MVSTSRSELVWDAGSSDSGGPIACVGHAASAPTILWIAETCKSSLSMQPQCRFSPLLLLHTIMSLFGGAP